MKCSKFLANPILLVNYSAAQLPCQPHFQAPERNKDLLDVCTYCTTKHFQLMLICELGHFHCSPSGQCLSPVSVAWHDVKYFYPPLHTHRNGGEQNWTELQRTEQNCRVAHSREKGAVQLEFCLLPENTTQWLQPGSRFEHRWSS